MHFSVCYPLFPYAFCSIAFFFLSSFSISLSILVISFLVYYFHSSLYFCSPFISLSELFSLFFIFGVFSFPLLLFLRQSFSFLSSFSTPTFSIFFPSRFFFLYVGLFPLSVHLSPCRPFSFSSSSLSTIFHFFFLSIGFILFPLYLLSPFFYFSFSFPMATIFHSFFFSSNGLLFLFSPYRRSFFNILLSVGFLPFTLLFPSGRPFSFSFSFSQVTFSLSPCRNSSSIFLSLRRPSFSPQFFLPIDCLPFLLLLPLVFSLPFFSGLLSPSSPPSPSALSFVPLSLYSRKLNGINASDFLSCI
ncbi:unnamed protein product [Acanthosepion pharaonis]|uniref:Uncharacterized protein n=1 Tax=Acanthosepion pharaonis TaxID=158019 RepID=A0A812EHC8_ACAPH|nr:unnamed protein product [Sepia pharaonis]